MTFSSKIASYAGATLLSHLAREEKMASLLSVIHSTKRHTFLELLFEQSLKKQAHRQASEFYLQLRALADLKKRLPPVALLEAALFSLTPLKTSLAGLTEQAPYRRFIKQTKALLKALMPWRKGPYYSLENCIDSEWNSALKWQRLQRAFAPLTLSQAVAGKTICDLGANNGYFMFQLAELATPPALVIGLEPTTLYLKQYELLSTLKAFTLPSAERGEVIKKPSSALYLLPLGYEALSYFPKRFDLVLALGLLYHHRDPIKILRKIHRALKPGGSVLVDCQGIKAAAAVCLFPQRTYAGKRGFYFLPSRLALENWVKRSGFQKSVVFFEAPLSPQEQRRTALSPSPSLREGLVGERLEKTKEGYPAPVRMYLKAKK